MQKPLQIIIIEPFYTGSHANWLDGIKKYSKHDITILTMPGVHWKWRMHGGCITIAKKFLELDTHPDLIIASDMLDLCGFLALTRQKIKQIPVALFFHENQLTYPWSPDDTDPTIQRDKHYAFINYLSALAADFVLFNSEFHMNSFLNALPGFLRVFPDYNETNSVDDIKSKSCVLPLGLDLSRFDRYKPKKETLPHEIPLLLWNHRWEYDKNPKTFFDVMIRLHAQGVQFKLAILGKNFARIPVAIQNALTILKDRIITCGYAESFSDYAAWLWQADIIPVTTVQEFFGISVMEALYCECVPLLPKRLTYPELIPYDSFENFYYDDDLALTLEKLIASYKDIDKAQFRNLAEKYDWNIMIKKYDALFNDLAGKNS